MISVLTITTSRDIVCIQTRTGAKAGKGVRAKMEYRELVRLVREERIAGAEKVSWIALAVSLALGLPAIILSILSIAKAI